MQFQIVRQISSGRKRVNGRMVDTLQAAVNFGDAEAGRRARAIRSKLGSLAARQEPKMVEVRRQLRKALSRLSGLEETTRHLERHDGHWTGWNSDSARRERAGVLESHAAHQAAVKAVTARAQKLTDQLGELKGKRGTEATAERKRLREELKSAKAMLAVAKSDLEHVATIAKRVDETHPEIVAFA